MHAWYKSDTIVAKTSYTVKNRVLRNTPGAESILPQAGNKWS